MEQNTFQVGPIRPPSEANSLLLQVTENCTWNNCKFCTLYKGQQFHTRPVEEIKKDIDVMAKYRDMIMSHFSNGTFDENSLNNEFASLPTYEAKMNYQMVFTWLTQGGKQAIFLQDANTMVLRPDWLVEIVSHIKENFPELERITSYGRADSLSKISSKDMKRIADAGVNRIHSGYESGSDKVLTLINKGVTQEQEIIGGRKVKEAGIELSIYFMPGVGGKELTEENAVETAKVVNEVNPDFVRLRTFVLRTGSPMEELRKSRTYTECTDIEKLIEIRTMLDHIDPSRVNGMIKSDHIINLLAGVEGYMDKDIPGLLKYIDSFLALPKEDQKVYQLARRQGFPMDWKHLDHMRPQDLAQIRKTVKKTKDGAEWEGLLHVYLDRYI